MGLEQTTVHLMWFVGLLVFGGGLATTLVDEFTELREVEATDRDLDRARRASEGSVVAALLVNDPGTVRVQLVNHGDIVLDASLVSVVFDGVARSVTAVEVGGVAGAAIWTPGTHANLTVAATWQPKRMLASDEFGNAWYFLNPDPPVFAAILVAPDPFTVPATKTKQFVATGHDQYGDPWPISPSWNENIAGANIDSSGLFTAGTQIDCGEVRASDMGETGRASVCVGPLDVYVSSIRMFEGAVEKYTFAKGDTARTEVVIVDAYDGAPVDNADVTIVWKDTVPNVRDTATDATDATGLAKDNYKIPNGGPFGAWTVEVSAVSPSDAWITYRPELNVETVQAFTTTP